jgi:predicted nucleotide-binding protein (sugar kinase/HSP70/actin superfamily)
MIFMLLLLTAIAMGDSSDDVYAAVKEIIQQHSSPNVWVATGEKL